MPELVARGDSTREVELAHRTVRAVADRFLEAFLLDIEAEKGSPARLEAVGLSATLDATEHEGEMLTPFGRSGQDPVSLRARNFRSKPPVKTPDPANPKVYRI
jgi:hypothetical protein